MRVSGTLAGGALALAAMAAAAPADAAVVLTQSPGVGGIFSLSSFDLTPYLSDAAGRTFAITNATLSVHAHSDPNYGTPTMTVTDTDTGSNFVSFSPPTIEDDVTEVQTTTYTDNVADGLTLYVGGFLGAVHTVSGQVSQVLSTTDTVDGGTSDGPLNSPLPFPLPGYQRTTYQYVTVHNAIYGDLDLSQDLDAADLSDLNLYGALNYALAAGIVTPDGGLPGFPGFPGVPGFPGIPTGTGQFAYTDVSLAFDLVQTGGPPPDSPAGGVPEPQIWALMIAGFGLAGTALRRRGAAREAASCG